jgi:hypothetical protein
MDAMEAEEGPFLANDAKVSSWQCFYLDGNESIYLFLTYCH